MEVTAGGGQQWAWALEANRPIQRREGVTSHQGGRCPGGGAVSCVALRGMWGWTSEKASLPRLQKSGRAMVPLWCLPP